MNLYSVFQNHPVICTDSRNCRPGSIFFALKGENFNANTFACKALENGCAYAVIDEQDYAIDERYIVVGNVLESLQELAKFHRQQTGTTVIGITGTNGKTTTKELIASVLSEKYNVLFTQGNLNNHIGVPLTLLQLNPEHELAIIEMGANHPGEIKILAEIACPDFGIITNVGKAHLEGFGSFEGVMKTKAELYRYINESGKGVFINASNDYLIKMAKDSGISEKIIQIRYQSVENEALKALSYKVTGNTPYLTMQCANSAGIKFDVNTNLTGIYNAENVMAAVAIGDFFKLTVTEIKKGIEKYIPKNNRSQLTKTERNDLIVDAYNANPTSMFASITNFAQIKSSNKMLILGDMLELGDYSAAEHQNIVDELTKLKFENVILVGKEFSMTRHNFKCFDNVDNALNYLEEAGVMGFLILIKGSRGIRLENLIKIL